MADKKEEQKSVFDKISPRYGEIKKIIAVMSGKGGVGKSTVTSLLALSLAREGNKVGILDADITGPSIPKMFGLKSGVTASPEGGINPATAAYNIVIMSLNLLLPNENDPVIWRGPILSGTVKQFFEEVNWGELDYLIVDLPPGTGDVPLTVMQSLPLEGLVIVSSPQELALMVVSKAIKMAESIKIPILGLVENMSYTICPNCGEKIEIFGPSKGKEAAEAFGLKFLGSLPLDPHLGELCDKGKIGEYRIEEADKAFSQLLA